MHAARLLLLLAALLALLSAPALAQGAAQAPARPKRTCAKTCVARSCDNYGITYGKYCGVTHTGCAGEAPCDAYDACCQAHDACVTSGGVSKEDQACHGAFKECLAGALSSGAEPWTQSPQCAPERVVKVMSEGMDLASKFSALLGGQGNFKLEL